MELRQLRYFVAVAEELHFRRAAARLHISQPPLSQQIKRLEEELGLRLLVRTRRSVQLTPAGAAFLRDARALLAELDRAVATARRLDAGQTGRLRVSFVGSALLSIVPGAVQRFRASHAGVEIELRERPTVEQLRALAAGVLDVGLVRPPIDVGPVWDHFESRCAYCDVALDIAGRSAHIDHAEAAGGNHLGNLVLACGNWRFAFVTL